MAESNFLVEKMRIGFAGLFNTLKQIASVGSNNEKRTVFSGTARNVYRLNH